MAEDHYPSLGSLGTPYRGSSRNTRMDYERERRERDRRDREYNQQLVRKQELEVQELERAKEEEELILILI